MKDKNPKHVGIHRMSLKFGYMGVYKYPINKHMYLLTFKGSLEFEAVRILSVSDRRTEGTFDKADTCFSQSCESSYKQLFSEKNF